MSRPRGPRPPALALTAAEHAALEDLIRRHTTPQQLALRARIIMAAAAGQNNTQIAHQFQVARGTVWARRKRWQELQGVPLEEQNVAARLTDLPRPGAPSRITPEQWCQLVALVCEVPAGSNRPISHWTPREIADEAVQRGLVDRISSRHVGRFLKGDGPQAASEPLLADARTPGAGSGAGRADPEHLHRLSGSRGAGGGGRTDGEHR